jgi:hypothetical protein
MTPEKKAALGEEDRRLLAIFEDLRAKELAAQDLLVNPRESMLYPKYKLLQAAVTVLRLKCDQVRLAIRAHRKKIRSAEE